LNRDKIAHARMGSNVPMDDTDLADRVRDALREVMDPEIGENIVDLGLVEGVALGDGRVEVVLIPTSATCPMAEVLIEDAVAAVQRVLPAGTEGQVRMEFGVIWSPARMSLALQQRFGWQAGGT
jgi:metal-sulfur cluster biosynthetic enzyme